MGRTVLFWLLLSLSRVALGADAPSPTVAPERSGSASDSPATPVLVVAGKAPELKLLPDLLHRLRREKIESEKSEHDSAAVYEGVILRDLLTHADVPEGTAIRGEYLSWVVVLEAVDGYRAAFSLAELDPAFKEGRVLLADSRDGKGLSSEEGPLRLVIPDEKRHARWIRQITRISVGPVGR